jgi:hypothetical protein
MIRRKAGDILRECVKLCRDEDDWCRDASSRISASLEPEVMCWSRADMLFPSVEI